MGAMSVNIVAAGVLLLWSGGGGESNLPRARRGPNLPRVWICDVRSLLNTHQRFALAGIYRTFRWG